MQLTSRVLDLIARLVPPSQRAMWRAEWGAEMQFTAARGAARLTVARRLCSAIVHAAYLRRESLSMIGLGQDVRFALRLARRQPSLTLTVVLTLALGIGANTAVYSVLRAAILRPLPIPHSDRLVLGWQISPSGLDKAPFSYPDFRDWRGAATAIDDAAAFSLANGIVTGVADADRVHVTAITPSFFQLTKMPLRGRAFNDADSTPGAERVAIVSDGFVRRRLGGLEPIGATFELDGVARRIVGVAAFDPIGALFDPPADLWVPIVLRPQVVDGRGNRNFQVIAHLRDGASATQADAELSAVMTSLAQQFPQTNAKRNGRVISLDEQLSGGVRRSLWLATLVTGVVLLVACANVASLLLVRNIERAKEFTLRAALGAGRARIARQVLLESALFSFLGGAAGLTVLWWLTSFLRLHLPANLPRRADVAIDPMVIGVALVLTFVTAIASGLPAAWLASPSAAASSGSRQTGGGLVLRRALVSAQLAAAVLLMICGGLLVRSFQRIQHVDPGFVAERIATMQINVPRSYNTEAAVLAFADRTVEAVRARPGVDSAAMFGPVPFSGNVNGWQVSAPGIHLDTVVKADRYITTDGALPLMGVSVLRGRLLAGADYGAGAANTVIDELFAARVFGGLDPIGRQVQLESNQPLTVVGITRHVKHYGYDEQSRPQLYVPLSYDPSSWMNLVVRSRSDDAGALIADVRRAVLETDPHAPPFEAVTVRTLMDRTIGDRRIASTLAAALAGITLLIAVAGLYGAMSFSVERRTREIGVRMALGARPSEVSRLVFGEATRVVAFGVGAGVAAAVLGARLIQSLLFETPIYDPVTYAAVGVLLTIVTFVAAYGPARRAAAVDPLLALRAE